MKLRAPMKPKFLRTTAEFRAWLRRHHGTARELLVGFYKRGAGKPSLTWPESVDEALCYGWTDGIRRRVDEESYTIRFTPRRAGSIWSAVNTRRARALTVQRRMAPAGLLGVRGAPAEPFGPLFPIAPLKSARAAAFCVTPRRVSSRGKSRYCVPALSTLRFVHIRCV